MSFFFGQAHSAAQVGLIICACDEWASGGQPPTLVRLRSLMHCIFGIT